MKPQAGWMFQFGIERKLFALFLALYCFLKVLFLSVYSNQLHLLCLNNWESEVEVDKQGRRLNNSKSLHTLIGIIWIRSPLTLDGWVFSHSASTREERKTVAESLQLGEVMDWKGSLKVTHSLIIKWETMLKFNLSAKSQAESSLLTRHNKKVFLQ